jgi:hypothetical protein
MCSNLVRPHTFGRHQTNHRRRSSWANPLLTHSTAASRLAIYWRRRAIQASSHDRTPTIPKLAVPSSTQLALRFPASRARHHGHCQRLLHVVWLAKPGASERVDSEEPLPTHWPTPARHRLPNWFAAQFFPGLTGTAIRGLEGPPVRPAIAPKKLIGRSTLRLRRPRSPQPGL